MKLVYVNNNRPVTDSLTIAETFGKEHRRVMQDIRELGCSEQFRVHHFVHTPYVHEQNGQTYEKCLMTEQGFTLLVMGYTGQKAMTFKEDYINEFEAMRNELNKPLYTLPQNMVEAVESYLIELKRSEALQIQNNQLSIESAEQKQKLIEQETPVAIYNLAIAAHNTMSMQEIAKSLGTGRTKLYNILREEKVVMKNSTMPYQCFLDDGYFKVTERPRASGDAIINDPATRVTAKGFEYIAKIIQRRASNS
jgi:anti-repressor protein